MKNKKMLYWNSFEQHPFPGSLMEPLVRNSVSFRISFGERLSGACSCQAEALRAFLLPDSGAMSLGTGVSDVQVRAETRAGKPGRGMQQTGEEDESEECGMQRQQLPQRVLHISHPAGKHLPQVCRVMPGKQRHFPCAAMPSVGSAEH